MTESRLRQIVAEEIRKALDGVPSTSSVDVRKPTLRAHKESACVKDMKGHTDHIHTASVSGSPSSELTEHALGRAVQMDLRRLRQLPKPKRTSTATGAKRTTGQ